MAPMLQAETATAVMMAARAKMAGLGARKAVMGKS
jgi:hypothetical protein